MAVNGEGTGRVARAVGKVGGRLVYVSTDYVFDGRKREPYVETDQPNPINVYGRSKLEGERQALAHCSNVVVVRTAWLYGSGGKNFVKTVMQLAEHEPELHIVADQRGSPTYAGDLAQAIVRLLAADIRGVTHATGSGDCTWHEFATAIISLMGSSVPVKPITTAEAKREAVRPPYTVLANRVLARAGITLPHWRDALTRFMAEFRAGAVKGERG
jgi:dTDP-4-dehydrorhamnose reductase